MIERDSPTNREDFEAWAARVAGTISAKDLMGMAAKQYVDWLRGPREDLDADLFQRDN